MFLVTEVSRNDLKKNPPDDMYLNPVNMFIQTYTLLQKRLELFLLTCDS